MPLIRRSKPPAVAKPVFLRRLKKTGFTDINGFKTPSCPVNWPFGMISPSERLAQALRKTLADHPMPTTTE